MKLLGRHMSRLTLAVIMLGMAGMAGTLFYEPAHGVDVVATASCTVQDPDAAARQRVCLVLPLQERQRAVWPLVRRVSRKHGLEPALVMAVIQTESRFFPMARSPRGAQGLMQINPVTARHLKLRRPLDPKANLEAGVGYLARLYEEYGGDLILTLAAYNAGPARVEASGGLPDIPETQRFVFEVLDHLGQFRVRYASLAKF